MRIKLHKRVQYVVLMSLKITLSLNFHSQINKGTFLPVFNQFSLILLNTIYPQVQFLFTVYSSSYSKWDLEKLNLFKDPLWRRTLTEPIPASDLFLGPHKSYFSRDRKKWHLSLITKTYLYFFNVFLIYILNLASNSFLGPHKSYFSRDRKKMTFISDN